MSKINYRVIGTSDPLYQQGFELREVILRRPLGEQFTVEDIKAEQSQIHFIGYRQDQFDKQKAEVVASCVLVPGHHKAKMQRVAVKENCQRRGIGSELLKLCEHYLIENNMSLIYCHARETAVGFYQRHGFLTEGDIFLEQGIPHIRMIKRLK